MTRAFFRIVVTCTGLAILGFSTFPLRSGPQLQVEVDGADLVLAWPTNAVGFRAQSRIGLSISESWNDLNGAPVVTSGLQRISVSRTNAHQFFRLVKDSGTNPAVSALALSTNALTFGSTATLAFDIIEPDVDLAALELTWTNVLGSFSNIISANSIGLSTDAIRAELPIRPETLPVGTSYFRLRLVDLMGLYSAPVYFTITIVGQGGSGAAPQLLSVAAEAAAWGPSFEANWKLKPGFLLEWNDPDSDVERIRAVLRMPFGEIEVRELQATRVGFLNTGGTDLLRPFTLSYTNAAGTYLAEFQLIDRTGRTSEVRFVQFDLDYSAPPPAQISGFSPGSGAPNSPVTLFVDSLSSLGTNFQVTLAGVPCQIITNGVNYISLTVPAGAVTAPFKLVTEAQVTASSSSFVVPPVITLTPDRDQAAPGEPVQFMTSIRGATNQMLTFSVNGIAGGNAIVGLISSQGHYQLPLLPPTLSMTVVASLTTQPGITATALVQVLPSTSLGGTGWVNSAQGGSVYTTDGTASLDVPPGALLTNALLSIGVIRGTNVPTPAPGRRVLGAVRLDPDGTIFNQPATVTLPLAEARPPGRILSLKYFIRSTGEFRDEGLTAIVAANGREAVGQISHFSEVAVDEAEVVVSSGPPQIFGLKAASTFHEGLAVPVLITGQNLVPGLRIEVLLDGQPTGDVIPSNVIFETNRLGLLLTIPTLRDLNFGGSRTYQLRLANSSNQSASTNLLVQGLNELIIAPGVQTNLSNPFQTYSEVDIGPGARVRSSGLSWFVNGSVRVAGLIDTSGANGGSSLDEAPGTNAFFSDFSMRGANGGLPDEYGHAAFRQLSQRGDFFYGDGGAPGEDISFIEDFINALLHLASCVTGGVISCGYLIGDIIEIVGELTDLDAGAAVGRPGLPGARAVFSSLTEDGHGGGGGGGGGDLNLFDAGEGGGAGGNGGSSAFILTRGDLLLEGHVDTRGGDGGDGGENVVTTINGGTIPFKATPSANRGGGGGGGSGGNIALLARGAFRMDPAGGVKAQGGNPGNSLLRFRDIDASSQILSERRVRLVDAKYPITPSGRIRTQGPLVSPRNLPDLVTDHGLLQLQLPPAVSTFTSPVRVTIRGENTNDVRNISFTSDDSGFRRVNLLFFPGFNTVAVTDSNVPDHPNLYRLVLYLAGPDSDADGLSDADEALLGTNPLVPDTDGDGLSDFDEVLQGLNPNTGDSDGDLISDADELNGTTDPRKRDTDGDGFWDGWELEAGTSPTHAQSFIPPLTSGTLFAEVITSINGRVLGAINPVSGKMRALGRINAGLGFGLAFSADGGMFASQGDRLVRPLLDRPADASGQLAVTTVGNFRTNGPAIYCYSLASAPYGDALLGIESTAGGESTGQFLSIDPSTGTATRVGLVLPAPLRALAVLNSGSTQEILFASAAQTGAPDALLSFPAGVGGAAQSLGSMGWTNVYGLSPAAPHRLYASRTGERSSELMIINTTNSTMTHQAMLSAPVFDLARRPCPVPCLNGPFVSPLINPGMQMVSADFNGDTRPDLAVAVTRTIGNDEFVGVAILHGKGDGTFTNAASYFFQNANVFPAPDIALADVNGDGRTDIILMEPAVIVGFFSTLLRPSELMVLLANNQGGFQAPVISAMSAGPSERLTRITAADWSGDGLADLIFVNTSQQAYSFQGNGSGLFTNATSLLPDISIAGVLLADVNGDGRPDFLGAGSSLNIRLANGAGGFFTNATYTGSGTYVTVGDVDGDGDLDAVLTDYGAVPTVYYNNGAGSFPTNTTFNPRDFPFGVFARAPLGDLSGDGRADTAVPSLGSTFTVYISGQSPGTLAHTMTEPANAPFECGGTAASLLITDLNNDGHPDIVVLIGSGISVFLGEESF